MTNASRLVRLLGLLEFDPGNLLLRLDAIREAFSNSAWDAARRLLDAGLEAHRGDVRLHELSGFLFLQAQRYSDAEEALRRALAVGLRSPHLIYYLAMALLMQGRYHDALSQVSALSATGYELPGLVLRARCLYHLRRAAEAIAALQTHLHVMPDDAEANGLLALLLYEQGHVDEARAHLNAALERQPQQVEALLALACLRSDANEVDAARASFEAIVGVESRCGRAWLGLALLNLREARIEQARRHAQEAAMHLPEHVGTWHVLAWTNIMLGDVDGARAAFEKALTIDRNFAETHGGLAVIAALQDRRPDAELGARRALRLNPESLAAKLAEILLLRSAGRGEDAKLALDSLLSRQSAHEGLPYRDLVLAQLQFLRERGGGKAIVYH
jgi:tetratricopeptide (TPR) repeat protein